MRWTWRLGALDDTAFATLLGVRRPIPWGLASVDQGLCCKQVSLALPDIPAGHWLLPSYSRLGSPYSFRFCLHWHARDGQACSATLANVGDLVPLAPAVPGLGVATPIDAFVSTDDLRAVRLTLDCWLPLQNVDAMLFSVQACSAQEWLSCSVRPTHLAPDAGRLQGQCAIDVPALSQMLLDNAADRMRSCSPVSLAMACSAGRPALARDHFVQASQHSGMYGVWPANIHAASRAGVLGSVELFSAADDAVPLLRAGVQIVASTRWASGTLSNSPLPASAGHLMLLRGLGRGYAAVHDPAAATDEAVRRQYPRDEFCRIWLSERGATYLLLASPFQTAEPQRP